jgi:tryptophan synthase alpha subunit
MTEREILKAGETDPTLSSRYQEQLSSVCLPQLTTQKNRKMTQALEREKLQPVRFDAVSRRMEIVDRLRAKLESRKQ